MAMSPVERGILNAVLHAAEAERTERSPSQSITKGGTNGLEEMEKLKAEEARLAAEVEALQLKCQRKQQANQSERVDQGHRSVQLDQGGQDGQGHQGIQGEQGEATTLVEIASMMHAMPTEGLVTMLARLRADNQSALRHQSAGDAPPSHQLASSSTLAAGLSQLPAPLSLGGHEASAMMEIMASMQQLPTTELANLLERLRSETRAGSEGASSMLLREQSSEPLEPSPSRRAEHASGHRASRATNAGSAFTTGRAHLLRATLLNYLRKQAPEALPTVEQLVALVVGDGAVCDEPELFMQLEKRYGGKVDLDPHWAE